MRRQDDRRVQAPHDHRVERRIGSSVAAVVVGATAMGIVGVAAIVLTMYLAATVVWFTFIGPASSIFVARALFEPGLLVIAAAGVLLLGPLTVYAAWTGRDRTRPTSPSQHSDTSSSPGQHAPLPDSGRRPRQSDPGGQVVT